MAEIATITSKRQLTIPISVFRKAQFKERQKVLLQEEKGIVKIQPVAFLVERLAGSVGVPKRFRGLGYGQILKLAKREYFTQRAEK